MRERFGIRSFGLLPGLLVNIGMDAARYPSELKDVLRYPAWLRWIAAGLELKNLRVHEIIQQSR
jgi:hypothetical protein